MVLPLIAWGGVALVSAIAGGSAIGLTSKPDEQITNQNTYQYDYITKKTSFDFTNSVFEKDSIVNINDNQTTTTKKTATQTAENSQESASTTKDLLLYAALGLGAYMLVTRK
jgi:hypothetical protein